MRAELKGPDSPPRIVIVGAGMAGLTAAACLSRAGLAPLLLEKGPSCGGLVASYRREGFLFDTGPRAIGNAGILQPLLDDLGINLPLVKGEVSTGIADRIIHYDSPADTDRFIVSLRALFPDETGAINRLARLIHRYTRKAAVLNKLPNPFFYNPLRHPRYLFTRFIPWLPSFLSVVLRTSLTRRPVEQVLARLTPNRAFQDMVTQHFFKGTPVNFALGYFANYQDYLYPRGGTGALPEALAAFVRTHGGTIQTDCEIVAVNPAEKTLTSRDGQTFPYDRLLWAADLKTLYRQADLSSLPARKQRAAEKEKARYLAVAAGESVFTLFLAVDEPPEKFARISRGHFIYTPQTEGLGGLHREELSALKARFADVTKDELFEWLDQFCACNSYEISIPVLKDPALAPEGKTGLVISLLMDGELCQMVEQRGWFEEFRERCVSGMAAALEGSVYPGLRESVIFQRSATPLTLRRMFGVERGAITGWSLEEAAPVPASLAGIMGTPRTALPGIYKAGQWSYSPSGVPVAVLTGRIAASAILRRL